jgi:hypothetical protein
MESKSKLALMSESALVGKVGNTALKLVKAFAVKSAKDKVTARIDALKAVDADAIAFASEVKKGGFRTVKNNTLSTEKSQKGLRFVVSLASQAYAKADIDSVATEQGSLILGDSGAYSALYANRFAVAMGWIDAKKADSAVSEVLKNPKGNALTELRNLNKVSVGAKIKPKIKAEPDRASLGDWLGMIEPSEAMFSRSEFIDYVRESTKSE